MTMEKYKMTKEKQVIEFMCNECGKTKKSKSIAKIEPLGEKVLCNGCFGLLLSTKKISR